MFGVSRINRNITISQIDRIKDTIKETGTEFDAICTKYPNRWLKKNG